MRMSLRVLTCVLLAASGFANAHTVSMSHVDIAVEGEDAPVRMELDVAVRDLALSIPLDADRDERVTWGELQDAQPAIQRLVEQGVVVSSGGRACTLEPSGLGVRRYEDGVYAHLPYTADCPGGGALQLDYSLMRERDPQHRALVNLRRGGKTSVAIARDEPLVFDVALARRSGWVDYLREGVHHILIGYDHLAFLLSLLLPAALLRERGAWRPVAGWRESIGPVVGIVTAFTVAHSITLTLAALGWVTPSSRWVEAAIAGSVLLAALNNVRPIVTRRLWVVGFMFGLIHGFGFAGALGELGLPTRERLAALVSFNVGVELGQIAVVAAALPLLIAVRDRRWYARWAMPALSIAIAALAGYWLWERLAG
ncbi:HupE/UreJ family protein [Cognatilysobacter bugurensis]|uniref:Membrane protein n=1 Tax=Cognatilysobacter bugurensis TaxID=543356 RepID=A0A918W4Z4_9GAMM|nr:HupE/UreJ family protein [Lysobacter bugurensis]GHA72614.1 membrane protein [Lysobacter bugurensis]